MTALSRGCPAGWLRGFREHPGAGDCRGLVRGETAVSFHDKIWFQDSSLKWLFWPFSVIFGLIVRLRRFLYSRKILSSYRSRVPVVVVGNIMVGGNGKTPVVIALAGELAARGFRVGVVSRGYGSHPPAVPYEVTPDSAAAEAGDEPLLIKLKTGVRMVTDPRRSRAVRYLEDGADVILTDDGLQHYALERDLEIAVIDGKRRFGNGHLLPMGPLREPVSRLKEADYILNNGGEMPGEYAVRLVPGKVCHLDGEPADLPAGTEVCALAGIGDPGRFIKTLKETGLCPARQIAVPDHGFVPADEARREAGELPVIMTEKDMVKYGRKRIPGFYCLGVRAEIVPEFYDRLVSDIRHIQKERGIS